MRSVYVCACLCSLCFCSDLACGHDVCFLISRFSEFEVTESQTCTFPTARHQCHIGTRTTQDIGSKHGKTTSCGARGGEEQTHQKQRRFKEDQRGLRHRQPLRLKRETRRAATTASTVLGNRAAISMRITEGIKGNASSSGEWKTTLVEARRSWWRVRS